MQKRFVQVGLGEVQRDERVDEVCVWEDEAMDPFSVESLNPLTHQYV